LPDYSLQNNHCLGDALESLLESILDCRQLLQRRKGVHGLNNKLQI